MRALVVGHTADPSAAAVAAALADRHGVAAVQHVGLVGLSKARWDHRIDTRGHATTRILLCHGGASDFDVVFHRLGDFSTLPFSGWTPADRDYGRMEWLALLLSWLQSLGPRAINRPSFGNLNGHGDRPWDWLRLARSVGFATHQVGATTSTRAFPPPPRSVSHQDLAPNPWDTGIGLNRASGYAVPVDSISDVVVVGDQIFGDLDSSVTEDCLRLARAAGVDVLGIRLARAEGALDWRFVSACTTPRIELGPPLAALVALLERRAEGA